jgi:hypothetical protein
MNRLLASDGEERAADAPRPSSMQTHGRLTPNHHCLRAFTLWTARPI